MVPESVRQDLPEGCVTSVSETSKPVRRNAEVMPEGVATGGGVGSVAASRVGDGCQQRHVKQTWFAQQELLSLRLGRHEHVEGHYTAGGGVGAEVHI